jgi:hypothetical protein
MYRLQGELLPCVSIAAYSERSANLATQRIFVLTEPIPEQAFRPVHECFHLCVHGTEVYRCRQYQPIAGEQLWIQLVHSVLEGQTGFVGVPFCGSFGTACDTGIARIYEAEVTQIYSLRFDVIFFGSLKRVAQYDISICVFPRAARYAKYFFLTHLFLPFQPTCTLELCSNNVLQDNFHTIIIH